jgi:hypothetical protein
MEFITMKEMIQLANKTIAVAKENEQLLITIMRLEGEIIRLKGNKND